MSSQSVFTEGLPPADQVFILTNYLESMVQVSINAMNTRSLGTSDVWPSVADDFITAGLGSAGPSKHAFLESYLGYAQKSPDHRLTLTGISTTFNSRLIAAQVYASVDVTGGHDMSQGMSRKVVIVCEFKKREGRWLFVAATSLPGEGGVIE